jgi:RNA 2',3'-cyclic 3'-phosphodiesterase
MKNGIIRSFIAIDPPPGIRQDIARVTSCLQKNLASQPVRWVHPDNIHLTLRFLGEITQIQLDYLVPGIQPLLKKLPHLNITVTDIGAFPNKHKARVLWMGIKTSPELSSILNEMDVMINNIGIPRDERSFSPHLTIGRVNRNVSSADYSKIESILTSTCVGNLGNFQVQSVNIYKSDLTPNGSVYTCLYSIPVF